MTQHVGAIPIYEVHGVDPSVPADGFESGRAGLAAELRAAVEAINVAAGDRPG